MTNRKYTFKETVQFFVSRTIGSIKFEDDIPNINFIFPKEALLLFEKIRKNPFSLKNVWTPTITQNDIELLYPENNQEDCPTIFIKDPIVFFEYLTDISNSLSQLYKEYNYDDNREILRHVLNRIWLRMGIEDFNNVELFLSKQLQFINNRIFERYKNETWFSNFYNCDVFVKNILNTTYDESSRSISFKIADNNGNRYELPRVLYDIDDNGICYIYAVQNKDFTHKDKRIERLLYKLNKNVEDPSNHPSQVCAIMFFIKFLKAHGITNIRVPSMQVLSYRYHELLSERTRINFPKKWNENAIDDLQKNRDGNLEYRLAQYEKDKQNYERLVDKQDVISKLKTEKLFDLLYRMVLHDNELEIINDLNIQGDYLEMQVKGK